MGIDNGGTMTKAAIFDIHGNEVSVASQNTPLIIPKDDSCERDMDELWDATVSVIKKAIEKSKIDTKDIVSIGCTGHGKGLYLWGKDNKPARNAITSTDRRAINYVKKWNNDGTSKIAKEKTLQNVIECQPVALLAWIKDNEPDILANTKWVFEAKDYTRFMLTGQAFAEVTDYSGTSLMNLNTMDFDIDLLKIFDIEEVFEKLPPPKYSYDNCGFITKEISGLTGLYEGTPVCGGMFDIDSCAIAMDVSCEDKLCAITGTWSINEYISKMPVSPDGTTQNSLFCIPGYYLIEESSPTSAGNLEWYINNFMGKDLDNAKITGKSIYADIDRMVDEIAPGESSVLFLPFLYGTNSDKYSSAAFVGLTDSHKEQHMLRAIFEGVVFSHKVHIDKLLKLRNKPSAIRLAGGAANSSVWVQMFADILNLPIERVNTKELGTLGCAMAGAVCAGIYSDYKDAARSMVRIGDTINPDYENHKTYMKKFNKYIKLINILGELDVEE